MRCLAFDPAPKGTLQGYASVLTDSGVVFHEIQIHANSTTTWCLMPSRHRTSGHIVQFRDDRTKDRFKTAVVACVSQFMAANP